MEDEKRSEQTQQRKLAKEPSSECSGKCGTVEDQLKCNQRSREKQGGRKAVGGDPVAVALQRGLYMTNHRLQRLKVMIRKINHNSET